MTLLRLKDPEGLFFDSRTKISLAGNQAAPLPPPDLLRGSLTQQWINSGRLLLIPDDSLEGAALPPPKPTVPNRQDGQGQTPMPTPDPPSSPIDELVRSHSTAELLKLCRDLGIPAKKKDKNYLASRIVEAERKTEP